MEILQLGAQLLSEKLGLEVDTDTIASALSGLLGDGRRDLRILAIDQAHEIERTQSIEIGGVRIHGFGCQFFMHCTTVSFP